MVKALFVTSCLLLAVASQASATVLVSDNFNDQNLTANPAWTQVAGTQSTIVDPGNASNYMLTSALDNNSDRMSTPIVGTLQDKVTVQFDIYRASYWDDAGVALVDGSGKGYVFMANSGARSDSDGHYVDGMLLETANSGATITPSEPGIIPIVGDGWGQMEPTTSDDLSHTFRFEWDRTTGKVDWYLDGNQMWTYTDATRNAQYKDFTSVVVVGGSGNYLDNLSITTVPEPMSITMLSLGGLALIRRRRK